MSQLCNITINARQGSISETAWLKVIECDPDLERTTEVTGVNPRTGEPIVIPLSHAAIWTAHPEGFRNYPFIFDLVDGKIVANWVDDAFVRKGQEIARKLDGVLKTSIE